MRGRSLSPHRSARRPTLDVPKRGPPSDMPQYKSGGCSDRERVACCRAACNCAAQSIHAGSVYDSSFSVPPVDRRRHPATPPIVRRAFCLPAQHESETSAALLHRNDTVYRAYEVALRSLGATCKPPRCQCAIILEAVFSYLCTYRCSCPLALAWAGDAA